MDGWLQDIRYGARGLMRAPALTLLCTAAIGLGMGANTAVFTLVNEILLRPLPVREPTQLVDVLLDQVGGDRIRGQLNSADYLEVLGIAGGLFGGAPCGSDRPGNDAPLRRLIARRTFCLPLAEPPRPP